MKIYLKVPFEQKDEAKKLGAKWDFKKKSWFIENVIDLSPYFSWLDETVKSRIISKEVEKKTPLVSLSEEELPWLTNSEIKEKLLKTGCYTYVVIN